MLDLSNRYLTVFPASNTKNVMTPSAESKDRVLKELKSAYPLDLSITEIAKRTGLSAPTVSTWLKVLHAEKKIEMFRTVGNATFYKFKKAGSE